MRPRLAAFLLAAVPSFPLLSENLILNRGFATDLSHWTVPSYTTGAWSPKDHGGGGSGSALLTSVGIPGNAPNTSVEQCVAVTAGHVYAFGASLWLPGDVAPGAQISPGLDVRFFDGPSCAGNLLEQVGAFVDPALRDTWMDVQRHGTAPPGSVSAKAAFGAVDYAGNAATETIQVYVDDGYFQTDAQCVATQSHLCLGGRFLVYGSWAVPSQSRQGYMRALSVTADSGLFWFFSPNNLEVFAKVLNACANPFNHYWVFASGLTNVQVSMRVDDTVSGETRLYENAAGTAFPPIQDTSAFATCP